MNLTTAPDIDRLTRAVAGLRAADAFGAALSPLDWQRFAGFLEQRRVTAGSLLIRRGDGDRNTYFVEEGELQVFVVDGPPSSHRIAVLEAGAIVGEPSLFGAGHRMAHVEAMTTAVVWVLTGDRFDALAAAEPGLALAVLRAAGAVMSVRMRAQLERGIPRS